MVCTTASHPDPRRVADANEQAGGAVEAPVVV